MEYRYEVELKDLPKGQELDEGFVQFQDYQFREKDENTPESVKNQVGNFVGTLTNTKNLEGRTLKVLVSEE